MNMKATQFTTTAVFFMRKTEVFPSDIESVGALKVNVSDAPVTESSPARRATIWHKWNRNAERAF